MSVVLVVEDEPVIRMDVAGNFEDAGFDVIEVATARGGLAMLEKLKGNVAALFTAFDMPGDMNGLELAGIVHSRWPHIALVVTSGKERAASPLPPGCAFLEAPYTGGAPARIVRDLMGRMDRGPSPAREGRGAHPGEQQG